MIMPIAEASAKIRARQGKIFHLYNKKHDILIFTLHDRSDEFFFEFYQFICSAWNQCLLTRLPSTGLLNLRLFGSLDHVSARAAVSSSSGAKPMLSLSF